jgi:hypothetical protein
MTPKVDLDRVRAINPTPDPPDDPEVAERLLRHVLAQPSRVPRPRRRRRAAVRVAAVAATAAAAAAVVALWPTSGHSSDVIASAAAALSEPDTILHFKTQSNHEPPGEEWHTSDGRESRVVIYTDKVTLESVLNYDKGFWDSYVPARNEIERYAPKDFLHHGPQTVDSSAPGAIDDYGNLKALLDRARDGDAGVHLDGDATIRGISTYALRMDFTFKTAQGSEPGTRILYVDREHFLPVRLVEHVSGAPAIDDVTDYLDVEQLPRTPGNERLLQMSPHPGATVRDVSGM